MKVSCSKTQCLRVNQRNLSGTMRLLAVEVKKMKDFENLVSTVLSNQEFGKEVRKCM